ncbi:recombinase family protein [uncultured Croceicoccus sp.]|uniref:recombinase family protein n=1 Tax=uncultured Croceicoccus sp. TaxID=1295329 RepID=UPI00261CF79B|nr:recombinase family protein [uncultured Croceicoccus sp.]
MTTNTMATKPVRCAIYTRKSSEEGLEQGFNSLDAQREACAAYILSQASEGWQMIDTVYDDGGISGGTLERPALQQLLVDVAAGSIDIIVVYKVDRLTRSLLDFARLVEALDKAGTSFVSITQAFNTTTSMGRLTLNMLLSFAQFEREVTAERIRDKVAASKAKGMWMGGVPPLGYKPQGRSLAIVEEQAAIVRQIFAAYRKLGNVRLVEQHLLDNGITVPVRKTGTGRKLGGGFFSRGQLYAILKNPIYTGRIVHHGTLYQGLHDGIIERGQWDKVQSQLAGHVQGPRSAAPSPGEHLLAHRIVDEAGDRLVATHACKGAGKARKRYRYYVSKALQHGQQPAPSAQSIRLPAGEIESLVSTALADLFADPVHLADRAALALTPATLAGLAVSCKSVHAALVTGRSRHLATLVTEVRIRPASITIALSSAAIAALVDVPLLDGAPVQLTITSHVHLTRTGRAVRLVQDNGALAGHDGPDVALLRLILRAREWWDILGEGDLDPTALAAREGVTVSYITRVTRLAFLAPQVIDGILAGRLKAGISARTLLAANAIDPDWNTQEQTLLVAHASV